MRTCTDLSIARAPPYCGAPYQLHPQSWSGQYIYGQVVVFPKIMASLSVTLLLVCCLCAGSQGLRVPHFLTNGQNGGVNCAACTIVTGLVEQLAEIYNISIDRALSKFCGFLPSGFQEACTTLVDTYGPVVIQLLEKKETPDVVCLALDFCKNETGHVCRLFPLPSRRRTAVSEAEELRERVSAAKRSVQHLLGGYGRLRPDLCNISVVKPICDLINRFGNDHLPVDDVDGDYFSDLETFRGTSWRGKDCNDFDADVHPGRRTTDDAVFDSNCNGIFGVDGDTGQTYEEKWCKETGQMGTVLLGDSAGAHFHIPPEWLTSSELSEEVFKDLFFILENELDWPMLSSATAYKNSTWPVIRGPVDSTYLRLREINRCNHRDYQNIAVNGARASAMADTIVKSFARDGVKDNPVFLVFALIGNDVCNGHHDSSHMTTPTEFYQKNLETFRYVDSKVAPGSVLIANGLVDGRILYNSLHNRTHPVGSLHNDVTYATVYDYLNCLDISPCFGWLNSNETWRNFTTERALQLNQALRDLVANETFQNFKAYYFDPPVSLVFQYWEKHGGEAWQLIEPVDGFHPNQIANDLNTKISWELYRNYTPEVIPPINPYNDLIAKKFGDQGGY